MRGGATWITAIATAVVCVALAVPGVVQADPFGTYATQGCSQGADWRVAFVFERVRNGKTLSDSAITQTAAEANEWVQEVGRLSQCGVQVRVDLYDAASISGGVADPAA